MQARTLKLSNGKQTAAWNFTVTKAVQNISKVLNKKTSKCQRKTAPSCFLASYNHNHPLLLIKIAHSICCVEQKEVQGEVHGLLGEREAKTPEVSSIVFLRAVSLATLWLSRLRRS